MAVTMNMRTLLIITGLVLPTALLAGGGGALLALRLETRDPVPRIVTADITGMTRDFTLGLARRDLDETATQAAARAWAERLATGLEATARQNRLVILPQGIGVFGVPDITGQLTPLLADARAQEPGMEGRNMTDPDIRDSIPGETSGSPGTAPSADTAPEARP